jgi:hypothetical protein
MLEKLLSLGSFNTIMRHLAHHQVILLASLGGLGLPSMVHLVALALGCWVFITLTVIFRYTCAMLPEVIGSHVLLFESLVNCNPIFRCNFF